MASYIKITKTRATQLVKLGLEANIKTVTEAGKTTYYYSVNR